jgi:hypothetical protein
MKFVPVPSRSPRILRKETLDTDPPVLLELVFDPAAKRNILSLGIGRGPVRRVWLDEGNVARLVALIVSLTMEKVR